MQCLVHDKLANPYMMAGWVNGNLYQPTTEVAGVLPIPDHLRSRSGMAQYIHTLHSKQALSFLAASQGTRKPVLPIHNAEERNLFREFMTGDSGFNNPASGPNWDSAVQLWNNEADVREKISYKLAEQLKVYYNGDWKTNANIKQTKAMTAEARLLLKHSLRDPRRSINAPPALESARVLHSAAKGLLNTSPLDASPPRRTYSSRPFLSLPATTSPLSIDTTTPFPSLPVATSSSFINTSSTTRNGTMEPAAVVLARKRAFESLPEKPEKKRKKRTCRKCAQPKCPGSRSVTLCTSGCQDCGERNCRGRNPKDPLKICSQAWE
ncbi:hypothetical protein FPV67DRAFT_1469766 [Lyophyllum atratum]|nr:hypothetical protein FPV67DRAFT_1469766 [Lyophyllum atratum]